MMKRRVLMTCQQAHVLLSQRLDGPLSPLGRYRLFVHMKVCRACLRVDRQFGLLRDAMQRLEP